MQTPLGEQIRRRRKFLGHSLRDLQPIVGIHYSRLSRIEHNASIMRLGEYKRLCAALGWKVNICL